MAYQPAIPSVTSTVNSSAVALAANGVFTGTSENVTPYAYISVSVIANVASATDGLAIQQSSDAAFWDIVDSYTIPAATGKTFSVPVQGKFYRVVYTNGATLQTSFRLQTMFHSTGGSLSSQRPQDARTNDNDMQEVLAYGMVYNGSTWDRLRGDTTAGEWVQVKAALPTGANLVGKFGIDQTTVGTTNAVSLAQLGATTIANSNGVTTTGTLRVTLSSDSTGQVASATRTTGGATSFTLISANTTNATSVKASAGTLYSVQASNNGAALAYLKIYNLAAAPTVGTSVAVATYLLPATSGNVSAILPPMGINMATGIAIAITALGTTADATAVGTAQVYVNLSFA